MRNPRARSAVTLSRRQPLPPTWPSKIAIAVAAVLSGVATPRAPAALAADTSSDTTLEEVIVTARKRSENLQDVPISVDVYTSNDVKNLAISQLEDYAALTPSISFISAGPGTQTLFMRGVSDGSNPNYSNAATTAFLVDDMSMNFYGATPDLHFYDVERIEVLNGPQGTTFGAGAMAGALRFITNKPDASGFSAGIDTDAGKIDGGTHNGIIEGFLNIPIIADWTALRVSGYSDYHGGYIDNLDVTRHWVNGTVSNNSQWAGRNYNVEKVTGGRAAIGQKIADGWKATLTTSYQRQLIHGAWDENPTIGGAVDNNGNLVNGPVRSLGQRNVDRFAPEFKQYYSKTMDFHLDGDVGIGELVYANTYWAQDERWVNEYSEYMQYVNTGPPSYVTAAGQEAYTCLTDPVSSGGKSPYSGCNVPTMNSDFRNYVDRWSNELRLQSKEGGRVHWLGGLYWEKSRELYANYLHLPGQQPAGEAWQDAASYYGNVGTLPSKPDEWYSYEGRFDYLQTTEFANAVFDVTPRLHLEAGAVHFHSSFNTSTNGGYSFAPQSPSTEGGGSSHKWNSKVGISFNATDDLMLYADWAQGFRDGGVNVGLSESCTKNGAPTQFQPDTLTNYELGWKTMWLDKHLLWNGAAYYMPWKNYQSLLFDPAVCPISSFNANIGDARIYGMESNVKYQATPHLTVELSASYNDSRITSNQFANQYFVVTPGERLPYVPYLNWSGNVRYEAPIKDSLHGYVQYDASHKGDMFNSLQETGTNGLPLVLQPGYTLMNLRFGLSQLEEHWTSELYITNLTNKNAVIYTNEGNYDLRQTVTEPRVFGMRLSYRFGRAKARSTGEE